MEEIPSAVPDSPDGVMPVLLEELAPLQLSAVFWRADLQTCLTDSSFPWLGIVQTSGFQTPSWLDFKMLRMLVPSPCLITECLQFWDTMKNKRYLNDEFHHLLKWNKILCSSSSNHCRWPEGVQHREEVSRNTKGQTPVKHLVNQQFLSSFSAQPALLGWFCVQTHLYLMNSRNSCTAFRELRLTPVFLSQWKFFYHPKSFVVNKAFCSDQKAILISEKPKAKRV